MDDDGMNLRRGRPQQKLYRPGSGPLRKSSPGSDVMESTTAPPFGPRGRGHGRFRNKHMSSDRGDVYQDERLRADEPAEARRRGRKPERPLYAVRPGGAPDTDNSDISSQQSYQGPFVKGGPRRDGNYSSEGQKHFPNHDHNFNRNYRQASEPRSSSPPYRGSENNFFGRNRDTRSMESSAHRHNAPGAQGGTGKPPSGRRNSAGYPVDPVKPSKYVPNIDTLPPRFRKKILAESGQQCDSSIEYSMTEQHPPRLPPSQPPVVMWSQTLPSRGRGRLNHSDFDREKLVANYLKSYEMDGSRHSTPSGSHINLYDGSNYDKPTQSWHNDQVPIIHSDRSHIGSKAIQTTPNENNNLEKLKNHMEYAAPCSERSLDRRDEHSKSSDGDMKCEEDNSISLSSNLNSLDWTEEVEKNIKLDDLDSSLILPTYPKHSTNPDIKATDSEESRRSNKPKRRSDRRRRSGSKKRSGAHRSSSRGKRREKSLDKPSQVAEVVAAVAAAAAAAAGGGAGGARGRERRDSHRSNRSSVAGSRDDLDRWRSWRSYSRDHSPERRIISQCNSREPSGNRAASPRDLDGFRVPLSQTNGRNSRNQRRNSSSSGAWSGARGTSGGRASPAPAPPPAPATAPAPVEAPRRRRARGGRMRRRDTDAQPAPAAAPPAPSAAPAAPLAPLAHAAHAAHSTNWREEILESKKMGTKDRSQEPSKRANPGSATVQPAEKAFNGAAASSAHPGLLLLPQPPPNHLHEDSGRSASHAPTQSKTLFDPLNPNKPIIVQAGVSNATDPRNERGSWSGGGGGGGGGGSARPAYYDTTSEAHRAAKNRGLLLDVERADCSLQACCARGAANVLQHWQEITDTRRFLQNALQRLLLSDIKFCSAENVEHHFWKILYYNFIEVLRKQLAQAASSDRERVLSVLNSLIEEGNKYFESLVELLEKAYKFRVDEYINAAHVTLPKGLGYVGLGLHSVQRLYLFLGDLARYKEQVNDTTNYGKSKYWYTRAQQINPKNGRPYNQLAILAIYSRRKLDAVYYYMRSLMSSNPFHSARESLISLFDENRKKYESAERKRRAAREAAAAAGAAAAGAGGGGAAGPGASARGLRREVWVRAGGGRTTTLRAHERLHDDELANMTCVELNKNFITSYLHVHGKLITKIGMETFHESAALMLRQFRALLRQQPLPTTSNRLLQLSALNMFAVETCCGAGREGGGGASAGGGGAAWSECALGVALLMFGSLLERCCALLPEPAGAQAHADALLMLPAIKVWCDWMLCHSSVWNPPPSLDSFKLGPDADPWDWLAKFMNILEDQDDKSVVFETTPIEGVEPVRLGEDAAMAGFTPLMYMEVEPAYTRADPAGAEHALRTRRLLFFGTEYLVGVEPPALRLHYPAGEPARYASAVRPPPPPPPPDLEPLQDVSEDEEAAAAAEEVRGGGGGGCGAGGASGDAADTSDEATRRLLRRKELLEARRRNMEQRRQRMQEILRGGWVSVELEVRPRWLVPDTNCFIDHLPLLQRAALAAGHPYILAVPLVVVTELEGLSRSSTVGAAARASLAWLTEASASASASVRFATTRGSLLASAAFTAESAGAERHATNDDRVLATALSLHRNLTQQSEDAGVGGGGGERPPQPQRLVREVVLLTDDRNLRVKALAAELPARDLPAFVQWAALPALSVASSAPPATPAPPHCEHCHILTFL